MGRVVESRYFMVILDTTTRYESADEFSDERVARALIDSVDGAKLQDALSYDCGVRSLTIKGVASEDVERVKEKIDEGDGQFSLSRGVSL